MSGNKRLKGSRSSAIFQYEAFEPRVLLACDTLVGDLHAGVAVTDDATGSGWMMYSQEDVHTRFSSINSLNADHFLAVRLELSQWQYNNNVAWVNFDPVDTDRLVAEVNFESDTITTLPTQPLMAGGIGFAESDDLWFVANRFGGAENSGEFEVLGTCLDTDQPTYLPGDQGNLQELAFAAHWFESVNQALPNLATFDISGTPLLSWRVELLPFLGYQDLYDQFNHTEPWNSFHNLTLLDHMPEVFGSVDVASSTKTAFMAIAGEDTVFPLESQRITFGNVTDGSPSTALFVKAASDRATEWTRPVDLYFEESDPLAGVGDLVAMLDGNVYDLPSTIDPTNFANMVKRNDGNVVDFDDLNPEYDSENSLRQLALSALNYESANQEFPTHAIYSDDGSTPLLSWRVRVLPFLGYNNLYEQFNLDEPWYSANNVNLIPHMPPIFQHPAVAEGMTNLLAVSGPGTAFELANEGRTIGSFFDGLNNTALFVEADVSEAVHWTNPVDLVFDSASPKAGLGALEGTGFNAVLASGQFVFVPNAEPDANITNLMLRADGQFVDFGQIRPYGEVEVDLRRLSIATLNYESAHQRFPAHASYGRFNPGTTPLLSWRVTILPFLGHDNLYEMFNHDEAWDSPHNLALLPLMPRVFASPGVDSANGFTSMLAFTGDRTAFPIDDRGAHFGSFTDGSSNTILFAKANDSAAVEWTRPADIAFDVANPRNGIDDVLASGFQAVFADGSVNLVNTTVPDEIVGHLIERSDGVPFEYDWKAESGIVSRLTSHLNNMRILALGAHNYESAHARLPAHAIYSPPTAEGSPMLSWRVAILPFIEHGSLYDQFHFDEPWDSPHNLSLIPLMPDIYGHPDVENGMTLIQAVTGPGTMFPINYRGTTFAQIQDGSSNTLMFVESDFDNAVPWTKPQDLFYDDEAADADPRNGIGGTHFNMGTTIARGDGSVDFLHDCVADEVLRNLILISDGNYDNNYWTQTNACHAGAVDPDGGGSSTSLFNVGDLNSGIPGIDADTGSAYIMFSAQNLFSRFTSQPPFNANSEHMILVRFDDAEGWQYTDNLTWHSFNPVPGDRLIAGVDLTNDTVDSFQGEMGRFRGIEKGYASGNLEFAADQFDGGFNDGEFEASGTFFGVDVGEPATSIGELNFGVAISDAATGSGYLMYTHDSVHGRFGNVNPDNADHLIAVRFDGDDWQYNSDTAWIDFQPQAEDRLLASVNFLTDQITLLSGVNGFQHGIAQGYLAGDLRFVADRWNGSFDDGEIQVLGSNFTANPNVIPIGNTGLGVAVEDDATGGGFILYSPVDLHTRLPGTFGLNADHFVAVRFNNGKWQYNTNLAWNNFTPIAGDRIVAAVNFDNDTVVTLRGVMGIHEGIAVGFDSGDLAFAANQWGGASNTGEFGISGTHFTVREPTDAGELGLGVAVADNATGSGYLMYSPTSIFDRFTGAFVGNSEHFVAVRHDGNNWQYNNNLDWFDFTPMGGDQLMAVMDFDADTIHSRQGWNDTVEGIPLGFQTGDLRFHANVWNNVSNLGEFAVTGTYFTANEVSGFFGVSDDGSVAVTEDATGSGYIMYSTSDIHTRFGNTFAANSRNLIAVRRVGSAWQFNNNFEWVDFEIESGDRLLARINFVTDTITSLKDDLGEIGGIKSGFTGGDLEFFANQWKGSSNTGEFQVIGTYFT